MLERITFLRVAFSAPRAVLLCISFLPWQALAGTCPAFGISVLLWLGSSQNCNLLPVLKAVPELLGEILRCVQYCPGSSCQNFPPVCENFISGCIYYGFQDQKRSPIVLGTIQALPVLDGSCFGWTQARLGVQGRREGRGCDTQGEWWFAQVGVMNYPGRFLFAFGAS